jgi:CDGSH-type Zn-finger protein/truncated hemoglobin YjbI
MSEAREPPPGGRLARMIATRGGLAPPEAPFVIEHREALIYMLCEAAELEHGIMCQYLYAAFSLKQSTDEGLRPDEAAATQRWRQQISHVATQEMLHLSLVQNLLSAVGAAPHLSRPNFPQPARAYPAGVHLALMPFGDQALRHFMFLERPEGMDIEDADGMAAFRRAVPAMAEGDIVPRGQDFATVGHLYRSIEAGIARLCDKFGEDRLFVGPPQAQATQQYFRWPELVAVTDAASAQRAIDEILEQGEGPRGHWQDAHFGQFVRILDEYTELREANPAFDPVRPVVPVNVRPAERDEEIPLVTDPVTRRVMDLFNVSYEILLLMMQRFFAHTEETGPQLKALADATIALMLQAVKPLGDLVTTLPAGPEYPGRTAGPSFELFYETDYLLPHREAAWILLTERLRQAASFCEPGAPCDPAVTDGLIAVRASLNDIAQALAAHLPSRYAEPPAPAEDLSALLASAEELSRTAPPFTSHHDATLSGLAALLTSAYQALRAAPGDPRTVARLVNSVLRPLAAALPNPPLQSAASALPDPPPHSARPALPDPPPQPPQSSSPIASQSAPPASPAPSVWDVAVAATSLRVRLAADSQAVPPGLLEATAALQDLAVRQAPAGERASQLTALADLQRTLRPAIVTAPDGPYLVTNVPAVRTPLGDMPPVPPQLALCRCGGSALKPFCDGTHARNGFIDAKDPHRVPDQRDTYEGQQVTVFDNRGICQHSGLCTDRLAAVFRTSQEPFVAPSGGRMDEIVRAVRDCPSGALGLAFDGEETRSLADWHGQREPAIEVTQDGPYRLTGGIPLAGPTGADVPRAAGSSREHYALCRCGHSQNKPFCSGMHWYVEFRDPVRAPGAEPTLFEWAGGLPALTRMTRMLYEKHVPADDLLAPLFAGMTPDHPHHEAALLAEVFGAPAQAPPAQAPPAQDSPAQNGPTATRQPPTATAFTEDQRARWVALASLAADEAGLPADPEFRAALTSYLDWSSRVATAQAAHRAAVPSAAVPSAAAANGAAIRWDWGPAGPPAATPAPASTSADEPPVALPAPGETVSFEAHIKPLFRARDRQSMTFAFDLWSYPDVQAHAAGILECLVNGTMPCDGAWPPEQTAVFRRWTESGTQP